MKTLLLILSCVITFSAYKYQVKKELKSVEKNTNNQQIDSLITSYVKEGAFNGNILVIKNGQTIYRNEFGYTNGSKTEKLSPNSLFDIGSISKEFSAVSLMILEEQNKLNLEDELTKHLENLPGWSEKVSVGHLLNFTSGLPKLKWESLKNDNDIFSDLKEVSELEFEPGTDYLYSNYNVFIRKLIIEKISGVPYKQFVEENVFQTLNLENTKLSLRKENTPFTLAFNNDFVNDENEYDLLWTYITVDDMYKWLTSLHSEKIISKESIEVLSKPFAPRTESALGQSRFKENRFYLHQHHGSNNNFESFFYHNLDNGSTIILLTNNKNHKLFDITFSITPILNKMTDI